MTTVVKDRLSSLHDEKSKKQQCQSSAATEEPAFQGIPHQQSEPKTDATAALQCFLPAHKNTPCILYAEGVVFFLSRPDMPYGLHRKKPVQHRYR